MWIPIKTLNLIFITQLLNRICRYQRTIAILIATVMVVLVACNNDSPHSAQAPSSATERTLETFSMNGMTLLDTRCSICHSSDRPKEAKKTREEWEQTVNSMIDKGAKLTDDEKAVLLNYLAKMYGDDAAHKTNNTKNQR